MYGETLYPTTVFCGECGTAITIMVDAQDVTRYRDEDMEAALAFASRDGLPYLNPVERELFISGICIKCCRKLDDDLQTACD